MFLGSSNWLALSYMFESSCFHSENCSLLRQRAQTYRYISTKLTKVNKITLHLHFACDYPWQLICSLFNWLVQFFALHRYPKLYGKSIIYCYSIFNLYNLCNIIFSFLVLLIGWQETVNIASILDFSK